jgi:hypothetical protein
VRTEERPHPGAQLRITDADGLRITGFLTNTTRGRPGRQLADLELRHRRHARVEDRIRAAKGTGLRILPFHHADQNRVWLAITALAQDLLAWCARLHLPATAAQAEPIRLGLASWPSPDASCAPPAAASCTSTPTGPGPRRSPPHTRLAALTAP